MPSKMSNRVSNVAKKASSRVSKGVSSLKSMSSEQMVICALLLILVVLVIYYVNQNRNENFTDDDSRPVVLYLFYVDWCPHCKTAKPQLSKLEKDLAKNNNKVNGKTVEVRQVNCEGSDEEKELARNNDVKAYPTVVLDKDGEKVEFNQAVSAEALNEFLKENLN